MLIEIPNRSNDNGVVFNSSNTLSEETPVSSTIAHSSFVIGFHDDHTCMTTEHTFREGFTFIISFLHSLL